MIRTFALASLLAASPVAADAAIVNGNFEAGGGSLAGWTVGGDVAALTGAQYFPCCGTSGTEPGYSSNYFASFGAGNVSGTNTLEQGFATVIGKTYTVSFDYGALGGSSQAIDYLLGGSVLGTLTASANNNIDTTFKHFSFSFVGTGAPTSIGFRVNSFADSVDPIIDNVSISGAVPEPAAWALLIAGFGLVGTALRRQRGLALG